MNVRRVGIEFGREARRPSVWAFIGAFVVVAGLVALALEAILAYEMFFQVVYLWMPLLFAPWGARLASRDRERGLAPIMATTPLTHLEETIGRLLFMGGFVLVTLLLVSPITLLAHPTSSFGFDERGLQFLLWGLYVGWSSAIAGILIGTFFPRSPPVVMALASLSVLGQYFVGLITPFLVPFGPSRLFFAALHAVPLLWPMEAMQMVEGYEVDRDTIVFGAAAAFAVQLLALGVVMALQDRSGWTRPRDPGARRAVIAAVALACVGGAVLVLLTPTPEPVDENFGDFFSTRLLHAGPYTMNVSFLNDAGQDVGQWDDPSTYADVLHHHPAILVITIKGAPNETVALRRLRFTSPLGSMHPSGDWTPSRTTNETGLAQWKIPVDTDIVILNHPYFIVTVDIGFDQLQVQAMRSFRIAPWNADAVFLWPWPHPVATVMASLTPGLVAFPLAVRRHRRWNRWTQ